MSTAESERRKLIFNHVRQFGMTSFRKPSEMSKADLQRMLADAVANTAQQQASSEA